MDGEAQAPQPPASRLEKPRLLIGAFPLLGPLSLHHAPHRCRRRALWYLPHNRRPSAIASQRKARAVFSNISRETGRASFSAKASKYNAASWRSIIAHDHAWFRGLR
jgi:hypothetical protein